MSNVVAKGTVYHTAARLLFVFSAYGIHIFVGRHLGPGDYGIFGVVISIIAIIRSVLMSGLSQATSKFTAALPEMAYSIKRISLKLQIILSGLSCIVVFLCAPFISQLLNAPDLSFYIRLASPIILLMGVYSVPLASLNGLRWFGKQAFTIGFYSIIRFAGVVSLVLLGFGIKGAIFGLLLAPGLALLVGQSLNKLKPVQDKFSLRKLTGFAIPIMVFSAGLGCLMNLDLLFVKSLLVNNVQAGYYTSAATISKAPYFMFYALVFTLLPSVSKAHESGDLALVKKYVRQALKYVLIGIIPLAAVVSATSCRLLSLVYSDTYIEGADALSILIWGLSFLTVFLILCTTLTAMGKPIIPMLTMLLLLPLDVILNIVLIRQYALAGAAMATTFTAAAGVIVMGFFLYHLFRISVSPALVVKIAAISAVLFAIAKIFQIRGWLLLAEYGAVFLVGAGLMFALKVLGPEDIGVLRGVFRRTEE